MEIDQTYVDESLDNAVENGYAWVLESPADAVAEDMADYDSGVEGAPLELLIPLVRDWQRRRTR